MSGLEALVWIVGIVGVTFIVLYAMAVAVVLKRGKVGVTVDRPSDIGPTSGTRPGA